MLQIYKSPPEFPNYIPFGMTLRALGQGLKVKMVASDPLSMGISEFLKESFLDAFSHQTWEEPKEALESYQMILCIGPSFCDTDWGWIEGLLKASQACDHQEWVIVDPYIPEWIQECSDLFTEVQVTHNKKERPMSKIITGTGKGKTTFALGEALYYASMGFPSLVLQFIKSPKEYGEVKAIKRLSNIEIRSMGKGFPPEGNSSKWELHKRAALEAWQYFLGLLNRPRYGFIVLDELNIALKYGYLELDSVKELLVNLSEDIRLALTGRYCHPDLFPHVDMIVEMKEIRHPYQRGIRARKGIEF